MGRSRWIGATLLVAVLLLTPLAFGGFRVLGDLLSTRGRSLTGATGPVAREVPQATSTEVPKATSTVAAPTVTPTVALTQQEAQSVVRAWFDALGAENYQRAEDLTSGKARTATTQLADSIQREAGQRGVQIDLVVRRLELKLGPQPPTGQAVHADFDIQVNALVGPLSVPARQFQGSGTFIVQPEDGGARITDIQDVSGLPTQ